MGDVSDSVPTPQNPSNSDNGESRTVQVISAEDKNTKYSERERLKTFVDWDNNYQASPQDLARDGFIYNKGPQDYVMCVFCFWGMSGWKKGDDLKSGHDPSCLRGCDTRNIPISWERNSQEYTNYLLELKPAVPASVDEVTRLETFQFWPPSNNQDPKVLAAAGFFYRPQTGKCDRVKCFMCGKILHRWEPDDDPWREHARISPSCKFVLLVKGQPFVDKCSAIKQATPSPVPQNAKPQICLPSPSASPSSGEDPLNHTAVKAVLEDFSETYSEQQVISAFQNLSLHQGGTITAGQLVVELMKD